MPVAAAVAVVAAASMVGLPPLLGFVTKETALASLLSEAGWPATIAVAAGSILTTAYALRFLAGGFTRYATDDREIVVDEAHSPAAGFVAGPVLLAIVTIVTGVFPRLVDGLVAGADGVPSTGVVYLTILRGCTV